MSVLAEPLGRRFPAQGRRLRRRPGSRQLWVWAVCAAIVWSLLYTLGGSRELVNPGGWPMVTGFFAAALKPELSGDFLRLTWDATLTTVAYASLGTALSLVIGALFGVVVSRTWWRLEEGPSRGRGLRVAGWLAARGALGLPRGVHEVVWGLLLVNILGLDPLVGVLAIGIPFAAVTAKVFSELMDEAPREGFDALRAAGVGKAAAGLYGLGPSVFPDLMSYGFYRFECAIRASAILGLVGAGGLGYQLSLSFSALRYGEMWTLIYALILVSGLADLWSTRLRRRTMQPQAGGQAPVLQRDWFLAGSIAAYLGLVAVSAAHLDLNISNLWSDRTSGLLAGIGRDLFPIALAPGDPARLGTMVLQTLAMSVVALAVSSGAAVGMAFVAAGGAGGGKRGAAASLIARSVLLLCRAVPPPVWALLLLFVLFPGPLPGAAALAIYNFGILGRLMAQVVENLDPRPARALKAQGSGKFGSFAYGVVPRALPLFGGLSLYRWEVTMREVVVVGLVGAGGLGRLLSEQLGSFDYPGVVTTLIVLVLMTFAADLTSAYLRRALR